MHRRLTVDNDLRYPIAQFYPTILAAYRFKGIHW